MVYLSLEVWQTGGFPNACVLALLPKVKKSRRAAHKAPIANSDWIAIHWLAQPPTKR